jgi:hypothetical protein
MLKITKPAGPYAVGQCDCMWMDAAAEQPQAGGGGEDSGAPRPRHKLMVRMFYPVEPEASAQCTPGVWLPDSYGYTSYAESYAHAMFAPGIGGTLVGALGFGPLMKNVTTQTVADAPLAPRAQLPTLPPVIYSHGLLGNRSCYSHPCIDLASRGFIVFALEHSDGSATINCYPDKTVVKFKHAPRAAVIPGKAVRIKHGFNKSLIHDNLPRSSTQHDLRNGQLKQRVSEVRFIADCLEHLHSGPLWGAGFWL